MVLLNETKFDTEKKTTKLFDAQLQSISRTRLEEAVNCWIKFHGVFNKYGLTDMSSKLTFWRISSMFDHITRSYSCDVC